MLLERKNMSTMDRYQVKTYAESFFVMDDRFKKYLHVADYAAAAYMAQKYNEAPEFVPVDPSIKNAAWVSHPKDAL